MTIKIKIKSNKVKLLMRNQSKVTKGGIKGTKKRKTQEYSKSHDGVGVKPVFKMKINTTRNVKRLKSSIVSKDHK